MLGFSLKLTLLCRICFNALEQENLVGGNIIKDPINTYYVTVTHKKLICGGAILDEWHVATAAHCVFDETGEFYKEPYTIVAGVNNIKTDSESRVDILTERVYVPKVFPRYKKVTTKIGDVAVFKLKSPFNLSNKGGFRKLKLHDGQDYTGKKTVMTGAGVSVIFQKPTYENPKVEFKGKLTYDVRYANVTVLPDYQCKYLERFFPRLQLCAQADQTGNGYLGLPDGMCRGDSGGPLVYNDEILVGINISGPADCDEETSASVYTNVRSVISFINPTLEDKCLETMHCYDYV